MPAESAADRAGYFDTDEFGVAATYTVAGGSGATLNGILIEESDRAFGERVAIVEAPLFRARTADIPTGAAGGERSGDQLTIGTRAFYVRAIDPDGTGLTELTLEEITL